MPQRTYTNPAPQTESAKEAADRLYCKLCGKGYGRAMDFEKHQQSYEHMHARRLKDLKETKNPGAAKKAAREKKLEAKRDGLVALPNDKLPVQMNAGFKKSGFKAIGSVHDKADKPAEETKGQNKGFSGFGGFGGFSGFKRPAESDDVADSNADKSADDKHVEKKTKVDVDAADSNLDKPAEDQHIEKRVKVEFKLKPAVKVDENPVKRTPAEGNEKGTNVLEADNGKSANSDSQHDPSGPSRKYVPVHPSVDPDCCHIPGHHAHLRRLRQD